MKKLISSLVVIGASSGLYSNPVSAHGYTDYPKARQAICQAQEGYWWPKDGSNIPNLACRAAYLESGHYQFVQEHEFAKNVEHYNDINAVKQKVPDGTLCSGGDPNKSGMSVPSAHWQRTVIEPNAQGQISVKFRATTPHNPSFWQFYLSKPGYDASVSRLAWSDLELINEFGNTEFVVDPDGKRYYILNIDIPQGREGDATLFTRWQRYDPAGEGFYNCSDITIKSSATPIEWHQKGYFVKQGQEAKAGDMVWFRLFNENGNEIINHHTDITAENQSNWVEVTVDELISSHANKIQIGIQNSQGEIRFNPNEIYSNSVFVANQEYTWTLTVKPAGPNTPPQVNDIADFTLDEGSEYQLHVHAYDDDQQDVLTFNWQIPAPLTYTGQDHTITITAPEVAATTTLSASVSVSDGQATTTKSFNITIKKKPTDEYPKWQENKVYVGGDRVIYESNVYEAKWWTLGELPPSSDVWKKI